MKRMGLAALLAAALFAAPAFAVPSGSQPGGGGGGGSGTVGAGTPGQPAIYSGANAVVGGPIDLKNYSTGSPPQLTDRRTTTTETINPTDDGYLVTFCNASPVAASLAQAIAPNFPSGWKVTLSNICAGTVTVTIATSTFNGASTIPLANGQSAFVVSNGVNYTGLVATAIGGGSVSIGGALGSGAVAGGLLFDSGPGTVQESANIVYDATNKALDLFNATGSNSEETVVGFTSSIVATGNQAANTPTAVLQVTKNGTGTQRNFGFFVGPTSATANLIFDYGLQNANTLTFGYNGTANVCMFNVGWCWNKSTLAMVGATGRPIGWTSTAGTPTGNPDTTLCRLAAGVVEAGSGTGCGSNGTVRASVLGTATGFTVANLPPTTGPTPAAGDRTFASDAVTCVLGSTPTGGGTTFCPVIYTGSAWVGELGATGSFTAATASDIWAGTDNTKGVTALALASADVPQTLTASATTAWNMANGDSATLTLTAASQKLSNPTNVIQWRRYEVIINAASTYGSTFTFDTAYDFGGAGVPALTAGKDNIISCRAKATSGANSLYCTASVGF